MFHINQSCAICSEFEAQLCKFMVIPLATLQREVSIREEPRRGVKSALGDKRKEGAERDSARRRAGRSRESPKRGRERK